MAKDLLPGSVGRGKDITGLKFGRWTVVEFAGRIDNGPERRLKVWRCRCECGSERNVEQHNLTTGASQSCGCLARERTSEACRTHGYTSGGKAHPLYSIWAGIIDRCTNKNETHYDRYGGRGISVCQKWMMFEGFLDDMGSSWVDGLTIDRIDNDGNYVKNNCRWATMVEQANNKSNTVWLDYQGKRDTISNWARSLGVARSVLYKRIFIRGWNVARAFNEDTSARGYPRIPKPRQPQSSYELLV